MKTYNVLMVYPKTPQTFWTADVLVKAVGKKAIAPPLGLMTIAAMLPENYRSKILDLNTMKLDETIVAWADLVFVTGMHIQRESFDEIVTVAKKLNKIVVAGGPFVTSESNRNLSLSVDLVDRDRIDYLVLYEAEINLPPFLKDFEQNKAKKIYDSKERPDLDTTPVPRFDLIKIQDYLVMTLQFSRGCPYNCDFCDIIEMFGRTPRTKSPARFLNEMDRLFETGFRGLLFIVDDNFIGDKKEAKRLLTDIVSWQTRRNYPFIIIAQCSLNVASDDELLDLMIKAGFHKLFIGLETPDIDTLREVNKIVNTRLDVYKAVEKIQNAGMQVDGGFILGFDTDKPDIFQRQIDFIRRSAIPLSMIGLLSPIPGTALFTRLEKEKRITRAQDASTQELTRDNFIPTLVYDPVMPVDQLLDGYQRVLSEVCDPVRVYERSLTLLSRLPDLKLRELRKKDVWRQQKTRAIVKLFPLNINFIYQLSRIFFTSHGIYFARFLALSSRYGLIALVYAIGLALHTEHLVAIPEKVRRRRMVAGQN